MTAEELQRVTRGEVRHLLGVSSMLIDWRWCDAADVMVRGASFELLRLLKRNCQQSTIRRGAVVDVTMPSWPGVKEVRSSVMFAMS